MGSEVTVGDPSLSGEGVAVDSEAYEYRVKLFTHAHTHAHIHIYITNIHTYVYTQYIVLHTHLFTVSQHISSGEQVEPVCYPEHCTDNLVICNLVHSLPQIPIL